VAVPPLACTVRDCGLLVERIDRRYVCARGHAYDLARRGYVNLLQPQDRRSLAAGDSAATVQARAEVLEAGVGRAAQRAIVERAVTLLDLPDAVVIDLGSGTGDLLIALSEARAITAIGIDLSAAAAEHASRRSPLVTWVVANADRRLPLLDRSVDLIVSLHGRRNPADCQRVLTASGRIIVAIPAADDLIELREAVQGQALERARGTDLATDYEPFFVVRDHFTVRDRVRLSGAALRALLRATYRGARASAASRVASLTTLDVTVASEVFVLAHP
jgi:23S rRNA (guanine745-N1)-methyltransferase